MADELGAEGPHELGGAHLVDAEEPPDVAPHEELPVELLALADAGGDGGLAATGEILSAKCPAGRLEAAWTGSRRRCRPGRRPTARCACGPAWVVGVRLRGDEADHGVKPAPYLGERLRADPDRVCRPYLASLDRPSSRAADPWVPTATCDLQFDRIGPERPGRLTSSRRR